MGWYEIFLKHGVVDVLIFHPIVDDIVELREGLVVWYNVAVHAPKMIVQLPLSVCLERTGLAQKGEVFVNISDVSPQVFRTNG